MKRSYHYAGSLRKALVGVAMDALDKDAEIPSWRALARACGVSATAPYRHFPGPDALRAAVAAECFRRFVRHVKPRLGAHADPFAKVATAIRTYLQFARRHPHWYELMFGGAVDARRTPEVREEGMVAFGLLCELVRACAVREPVEHAFVLWAAHHGLADLGSRGLDTAMKVPLAEATERLVRMSTDYLRAVAGDSAVGKKEKAPAGAFSNEGKRPG